MTLQQAFELALGHHQFSRRMIAKAAARGIYDRLITGDVAEAMRDTEGGFDLILAGDMFVYVGDLGGVFRAAARALRNGGLFAFSLERHDGEGFVLHSKVRFAHSLGYIRELARKHDFAEVRVREITVRKEGAQDVAGWLVVLGKSSGTSPAAGNHAGRCFPVRPKQIRNPPTGCLTHSYRPLPYLPLFPQ